MALSDDDDANDNSEKVFFNEELPRQFLASPHYRVGVRDLSNYLHFLLNH